MHPNDPTSELLPSLKPKQVIIQQGYRVCGCPCSVSELIHKLLILPRENLSGLLSNNRLEWETSRNMLLRDVLGYKYS